MGKIIRNGIEYSGSYDNAISINYDNTNSGLNATTVQEGIDEIKEDLKPHANVNPVANLLTTEVGYALDATQGKVLDDKISAVNNSLNGLIKSERHSLTANNTKTVTITLSQTAKLILSVYCDGGTPITIDRYTSGGKDIVVHFAIDFTADTRINVVYI